MKHYRALKTIVNGQAVYGNLPSDFVYFYDHEGYGYFCLLEGVAIPEGATVEEVTDADYKAVFHTITENHRIARETEQAQFLQAMKDREALRQQEIDTLKAEIEALKASSETTA